MHLFLAFFLSTVCALADGKVTSVVRTDYYEVSGNDVQALVSSMKKQRYFSHNAYTEWYVDWNYEFLTKPEKCILQSFDTRVQIRYTLPKWVSSKNTGNSLRDEWKRYMAATTLHEQGHSAIGVAAAKEMVRLVNSKKWSAANGKELRALLDKECEAILKQFRDREVRYDVETDHGRTQGARIGSGE